MVYGSFAMRRSDTATVFSRQQRSYTSSDILSGKVWLQGAAMSYAKSIAKFRKARGLSQSRLAELMEVEQPTVQRWESGKRQPSAETMVELARVLGGSGGSSQARKVFYRVDDGASSFLTGIYNRNSVTVAPDYETQRFVKLAATARNRVVIRLETYAGEYVDADLAALGASANIGKIMDFCSPK